MLNMMATPLTIKTFCPETLPFHPTAWTVTVVRNNGSHMVCKDDEIGQIWIKPPRLREPNGRLINLDPQLFNGWVTVHGWTGIRQEGPFHATNLRGIIRDGQVVCLEGDLAREVRDLKVRIVESQRGRLAAASLMAG
ncbi:hypothetical protein [Acanthopleuribacter pedis]|uniref:Uncharacterized protein n=1 Tax=Acanthopleuribacter pedis TaxID=442870 RepID=A0A8J7U4H1_9BACT|nr:hypothetical protein [Acanthopleuribacter pedis]MBO1320642.1 hypothetical protein [Acanthopleuribacter pedis]